MKLSGVMLGSDRPKELGEFYTKIFGKAGWQQDDWYGFDVNGGTLMVGPHSEVHGKNSDSPRIMISIESDDVQKTYELMVEAGAAVVAEPYQPDASNSPDIRLATVSDIDGNYLQIASPWEA